MSAGSKPCRFTPAALADLEAIWDYTAARWSPDQADDYINGLAKTVDRIGANPGLARDREEFSPPVRILPYRSHIIIYSEAGDHVRIIRVRHGREDWARDPAAGGLADRDED